jgi:hypothetical protein
MTRSKRDPDEVVHLQVKAGRTLRHQGKAFGDRATVQAAWRDAEGMLKDGDVEEVDPANLPDAAAPGVKAV